jgi:indole-3-glycerol phosphate synthase
MARFTQAISEGDGISLVPFLSGDVEILAAAAAESGADAVAVASVAEVERVRAVSGLPVLLRRRVRSLDELTEAERAGADAVVLGIADFDEESGELERLHAGASARGLDCAIEVDDEDGLESALERLDVLPDVPAGKLVLSETRSIVREQLSALERAGVDAVLVSELGVGGDLRAALADLAGRE